MSTILTNVDPSCPVWEVSNFNLPDFDTDNLIHKTFEQVKDSKNHTNTLRQVCEYPYENFATEWRNNCIDIQRCLLYTSPSPRDGLLSRMPSSA